MKSTTIYMAIACAISALMVCACNKDSDKITPEDVYDLQHPNLPSINRMRFSSDPDLMVHYSEAIISGSYSILCNNAKQYASVLKDNSIVKVIWGKERDALTHSTEAIVGELSIDGSSSSLVDFHFQSKIENLDEGAYFYYQLIAQCGETTIETDTLEFFTLMQGPVDLGLTSGKLWSSCNLGATYPEESGDHYAWGETEPKADYMYDWPYYKWCHGKSNQLTKYCRFGSVNGYNGFEDNKDIMMSEDDAATKVLGVNWSIPSLEDWSELANQCLWQYIDYNKTEGILLRTKTDSNNYKKALFIPIVGYYSDVNKSGRLYHLPGGDYWTNELLTDIQANCWSIMLFVRNASQRCEGLPIRPVKTK